jgi:hypothetical protein
VGNQACAVPTTHPQHDAVSYERMVGTLRFAHPTDYGLVWHKFKCIVIHGLPTLPRDGELTEYFPQNRGGRVFTELFVATHPPRKNLALPHEKLRAFSLPQDS